MTLTEAFDKAVAESKTLTSKPDNDALLRLYSLYKQATIGDAPKESGGGMFDFVGKAKHEAWKKSAGTTKEEAMQQYIILVEGLKNI